MVSLFLKDDNIKVDVPSGKSLREVARKTGASMEFGCRIGDCATCIAQVTSGQEFLSEKNEKELLALKVISPDNEKLRLMCQCSIEAEEGEVEISYFF